MFEPSTYLFRCNSDKAFYHDCRIGVKRWDRSQKLGLGIEDTMRRYAVLEVDLLRGKIIRRNVCTTVVVHTRGYCPPSTAFQFYTNF